MNRTKIALLSSAVLATSLVLAGCSSTSGSGSTPSMSSSMGPSSTASAADFNTQDVMFAQMMLPHHKQAVQMSDMLLAKGSGVNARVSSLATKIKEEQTLEITELTTWLKNWNKSMSSSMGSSMSGMMSSSDMGALDKASATDASKLFLTQMIQHHTGAITMAKTEISGGKSADAVALAKSIVTSQSAEITQMTTILASL